MSGMGVYLCRSQEAGYALQLAINALQLILRRNAEAVADLDLHAVLKAASHSRSIPSRKAALALLAHIAASSADQAMLEQILEVGL